MRYFGPRGSQHIMATDTVTGSIHGTSTTISVVSPPPPFSVSPNSVSLQYALGSTPPSPIQTFSVSSNGSYVQYSVQSSQPWLVVPANGTATTSFGVNLNPAGLTQGTYSALLTVLLLRGGTVFLHRCR